MRQPRQHQLNPVLLNSFWQRARGLLLRESLLGQAGVLIQPCRAIHTFGMSQAIDVIFLDRLGAIKELHASVKPFRMVRSTQAGELSTLELSSGSIKRYELWVGDLIKFTHGK
jgi:uncharacterized protein